MEENVENIDNKPNHEDKIAENEKQANPNTNNSNSVAVVDHNDLPQTSQNGKRSKENSDVKDEKTCVTINENCEGESSKRPKLNETFNKLQTRVKNRNYRKQSSDLSNNDDVSSQETNKSNEEKNVEEPMESKIHKDQDDQNSSSESDQDIEDGECNDWSSASAEEVDEILSVLQKKPSKSSWSLLKELNKRQIDCENRVFQNNFYGSLYAVQHLELLHKMEGHDGCVNSLGFNSKGNLLLSASDDLSLIIWDWTVGKKLISLKSGHKSNVFQSKWLPLDPENFVVTSARDGQIRLMNVHTRDTRKLACHTQACHKISTHTDYPYNVLSAGEDAKVFSIDIREKIPTKLLTVTEKDEEVQLYSIHSNPLNSNEFCVCGHSSSVRLYDRRNVKNLLHILYPEHLLENKIAHVTSAIYNHNGTEIVASYNNDDIYLFDTTTSLPSGNYAHRYQGHRNNATVKGVNFFGPYSEFIISGSDCGHIYIWDKKTEAIVQWLPGDDQGIVNVLEPHPHIPILATCGLDSEVKVWIPSSEKTFTNSETLNLCVKRNLGARLKNNGMDPNNAFDGHVLWYMLRHLDRTNRMRLRSSSEESNSSPEETSEDENSSDLNEFSYNHETSDDNDDNVNIDENL